MLAGASRFAPPVGATRLACGRQYCRAQSVKRRCTGGRRVVDQVDVGAVRSPTQHVGRHAAHVERGAVGRGRLDDPLIRPGDDVPGGRTGPAMCPRVRTHAHVGETAVRMSSNPGTYAPGPVCRSNPGRSRRIAWRTPWCRSRCGTRSPGRGRTPSTSHGEPGDAVEWRAPDAAARARPEKSACAPPAAVRSPAPGCVRLRGRWRTAGPSGCERNLPGEVPDPVQDAVDRLAMNRATPATSRLAKKRFRRRCERPGGR